MSRFQYGSFHDGPDPLAAPVDAGGGVDEIGLHSFVSRIGQGYDRRPRPDQLQRTIGDINVGCQQWRPCVPQQPWLVPPRPGPCFIWPDGPTGGE